MATPVPNIALSWEERQLIKSGLSALVRDLKKSADPQDPIIIAKLMKKLNRAPACVSCKGSGRSQSGAGKCGACSGSGLGVAY